MMRTKIVFSLLASFFLFLPGIAYAIEINIPQQIDTKNVIEQLKKFFEKNPFPDSAYAVEIDKDVQVSGGTNLNVKIRLKSKKEFFKEFKMILERELGYEAVPEPFIGIIAKDYYNDRSRYWGIKVARVLPDSPAAKAGIQADASLYEVNGQEVKNVKHFNEVIQDLEIGKQVVIDASTNNHPYRLQIEESPKQTKILKRKVSFSQGEEVLELDGQEYAMPSNIMDLLVKKFTSMHRDKSNKHLEIPIVIKYDFSDEKGQIVQSTYSNFTAEYSYDYVGINLDRFYWQRGWSDSVDLFDFEPHSIKIDVPLSSIKNITASVFTIGKRMEDDKKRAEEIAERERLSAEEDARYKEKTEQQAKLEKERIVKEKNEKKKKVANKCKGDLLDMVEFYRNNNPYADKGKCVEFYGASFQMTSEKSGLFRISDSSPDLMYVEFEKAFHGRIVSGIARIEGVYSYRTNIGGSNSVPKLRMLVIESNK